LEVTFVHYKQSSLVKSSQESSVSYAAAIARVSIKPK
jgi:predicted class III extradiol MEMO1 family dioxygenase